MKHSPKKPTALGGISLFLMAVCWLLQQPTLDTRQWNEKMWVIHKVNNSTENFCAAAFALSALIFFGVAFCRWLKCKQERNNLN